MRRPGARTEAVTGIGTEAPDGRVEAEDARICASVELGEARAKLSAAEKAVAEKQMVAGAQLADEARADAELAAARAGAAKANTVNAEIKRSTATLVEEMQRKFAPLGVTFERPSF